jgi:hypothetical protein
MRIPADFLRATLKISTAPFTFTGGIGNSNAISGGPAGGWPARGWRRGGGVCGRGGAARARW